MHLTPYIPTRQGEDLIAYPRGKASWIGDVHKMAIFFVATLFACTISIASCDSSVKLLDGSFKINKEYGRVNSYKVEPPKGSQENTMSSDAELIKDIPMNALIGCAIYAEKTHDIWTEVAQKPKISLCEALKSKRVPYGIELVGLSALNPKVEECPVKKGKFVLRDFVPSEKDLPTTGGGIYRVVTTWYTNSKDTVILKWKTTYQVGVIVTK